MPANPPPRADALDLEALDALCRAATPGPWHAPTIAAVFRLARKTDNCCFDDMPDDQCVPGEDDAEWIARAREDMPALVARLKDGPPWLADAAKALGETMPDGKPLALNWSQVLRAIEEQRALVRDLAEALGEACDVAEDGIHHKGPYLAEKYGDVENVAKWRALVARARAKGGPGGGL